MKVYTIRDLLEHVNANLLKTNFTSTLVLTISNERLSPKIQYFFQIIAQYYYFLYDPKCISILEDHNRNELKLLR